MSDALKSSRLMLSLAVRLPHENKQEECRISNLLCWAIILKHLTPEDAEDVGYLSSSYH
jgi:hypothetical protein